MQDANWHDVLEAEHVSKTYPGERNREVLHDVSLSVGRGSFVALMGPSGSGKSTLLGLLGALDSAYSGTIRVAGRDLRQLSDDALTRLRRTEIGLVFQQFHLLPGTSVLHNVALPLAFAGVSERARRERALRSLESVGLSELAARPVTELSGGERQRVAIARALIQNPHVLLADEPTGSLDQTTGQHIIELLATLNRTHGLTIFLVTHDPAVARHAHRLLTLRDGQLHVQTAASPVEVGDVG
jgi:putative ABC transport system ATP-binding protein